MRFVLNFAVVIPFTIVSFAGGVQADEGRACRGCPGCCNSAAQQRDGWVIIEAENFSVWSRSALEETRQLTCHCESLRASFVDRWHDETDRASWSPKCAVVVHADLSEYRRAVACGPNPSAGCTTITTDGGRVVFRRIDLRADAVDWRDNALPHELAHVVLADRFPEESLPAWLNEGLAMTVESPELQQRRLSVLEAASATDTLPSLNRMLQSDAVMRVETDVFYAVSHSLVGFLHKKGGSRAILQFAELSLDGDYSAALRQTYRIQGGLPELEREWLKATRNVSGSRDVATKETAAAHSEAAAVRFDLAEISLSPKE